MTIKDYHNVSLRRRFPTHREALDRIAELEDLNSRPDGVRLRVLGLTVLETRIVSLLARYGRMTRERLQTTIWGEDEIETQYNALAVHLMHIRRQLAKSGTRITIKTIWGGELEMSPESRALWRAAEAAARDGGAA